jgi:2-isopropylmalate synthase
MDTVLIFDTTLRDGEQSPGATLTIQEKMEIAKQLARLKVDIIEAGFPIASPGDFEAVRRIAEEVGTPDGPVIAGLARATEKDILRAWEAVKLAAKPRIHTFLATSDIHLEHKLRISREECLRQIRDMVKLARSLCNDVEFSPEDAGRTDTDFLYEALAMAVEAGATTINIPDTVGYCTPEEYGDRVIGEFFRRVPGADRVIVSTHTHNDLGLAVANALAGVRAGARQVECTINGIGERAGNCSMEEVVMTLHTRKDFYNLRTNIDTTQIMRTSRMVSSYTGMPVQPNKAIVGANAFAHEAGIHQDGMLKHHLTYEIMRPETVGIAKTRLVMGKHSGRHAFRVRLQELGYDLSEEEINQAFERMKRLADKKKQVTDHDILAIIADEFYQPPEIFQLEDIQVTCGRPGMPTATIRVRGPAGPCVEVAVGTGPVDATYKAIARCVGVPNKLLEYSVNAITEGIDALGEVMVRLTPEGAGPDSPVYSGHGADTDIIVASAKAYVSALNKLIAAQRAQEMVAAAS